MRYRNSRLSSRKQRFLFYGFICSINIVFLLFALEAAARIEYFTHHKLSFWTPATNTLYRYYPDLPPVLADRDSEAFRVVISGGSTLNHGISDVDVRLKEGLQKQLARRVTVFNLATPAQGTLDGYYKYEFLRSVPFDLVILYYGINELRANYVPKELWRDDYSHYAWYEEVNFLFRHRNWARLGFILPFYLEHDGVILDRKWVSRGRHMTYNSSDIRPDWMNYGSVIRSAKPFRYNLERILQLAKSKDEPVVLMTFAYCIPEGYSEKAFRDGKLGYDKSYPGVPVELFGKPEDIKKGLAVHNAIIQELAGNYHALLIDQQKLIRGNPKFFVDVCHLSPAGSKQFADNLLEKLYQGIPEARDLIRK